MRQGRGLVSVVEGFRPLRAEAKQFFEHPGWASWFYAVLGDRKKTLENLTRLYNEDRSSIGSWFSDPFFDKYRTDTEFVELLKKAGFEF